ncbi:hypothetical protein GCM10027592_29140 [Spirosoma flavus]
MAKEFQQMTVEAALVAGYTKCIQDGYSHVEDIDDVATDELEEDTYWIVGKESKAYSITAKCIKDMIADHVRDQDQCADEDDVLGETIDKIPIELFAPLTALVNEKLAEHEWWPNTNIQLIP